MSKEIRPAPFEQETGMPLPILITSIPPGKCTDSNRHHAFYDRVNFEHGTEGSRAVRLSRVQTTPIYLHNRFHNFYKAGMEVPADEHEEFRLTILGYAGYVPEKAVDVSRSSPKEVHINRAQRRELRQPGVFTVEQGRERSRRIGDFLISYVTRHGLDMDSDENLVDEFLGAKTFETRWKVGMKLVENATDNAAEPFDQEYVSLRKKRLLNVTASRCPRRLVRNHIDNEVVGFPSLLEKSLLSIVDQQG